MSQLVSEMMKINFILKTHVLCISALVEYILSVCLNIHTLPVHFSEVPSDFHYKFARLKKLKKLEVFADEASNLKEVTLIASS
jgi:hypothetical protein